MKKDRELYIGFWPHNLEARREGDAWEGFYGRDVLVELHRR
jgi:hypothetical protein